MPLRANLLGMYHLVRLVRDPNRLNEVFELVKDLSASRVDIIDGMIAHVRQSPRGEQAMRERPRLGRPSLQELRRLPDGTLGRSFAETMIAQGLDPAAIPEMEANTDRTFLRSHLYETHDVWHAVTGFGTDVAGELGLQVFYAAQLPSSLPIALLSAGMLNTLLFSFPDRERRLEQISRGWMLGRKAEPLFGVRWAEWWARPLAEVRAELKIEPVMGEPLRRAA